MPKFDLTIKAFGTRAILIEWPNRIDDAILDDIIRFTPIVLDEEKHSILNYTPGYNTLLLQYDRNIDFESKEKRLLKLYTTLKIDQPIQFNTWHIPVCYDDEFGMDLPLFEDRGLSRDDVVRLHTSARYRIFMIGFLPGFLYLGGLPKLLHLERKDKPRTHVSKGSVAIGGEQTGIYPTSSPGGWQIIGRTPLTLFDISLQKPTPIRQGDQLYFYEIDKITYKILSSHKEKSETQKV